MKTKRINQVKYAKTKKGLSTVIYSGQVKHSLERNHPKPSYTKEEFREWLFKNSNFDELYDNWVISDYNKWMKPSVDRIDDSKGYSFDNIRLVTWRENSNNFYKKNDKNVEQYDIYGNFINEFESISIAIKYTGIYNIKAVCLGKRNTAGGYHWKFK